MKIQSKAGMIYVVLKDGSKAWQQDNAIGRLLLNQVIANQK